MSARGHLKKVVLVATILFSFIFSIQSFAFKATSCAELLRSSETSAVSLAESPEGREIYKALKELVAVHPDTYAKLREQATREHFLYKDLLVYISEDRARITAGLEALVEKASGNQKIKDMIAHTLAIVRTDERPNETDYQNLQRLMSRCGGECGSDVDSQFRDQKVQGEIESFAQQFYAKNYSFISELLTAFEVKGFAGIGFHLKDLFTAAEQKRLLQILEKRGEARLATLEIDVGTIDATKGIASWIEVKHVNRRIEKNSKNWMNRIRERVDTLKRFVSIVQSDPELRKAWPYKTDFRFIIRGAGMEDSARSYLLNSKGIIVYDRDLSEFNEDFGKAYRQGA